MIIIFKYCDEHNTDRLFLDHLRKWGLAIQEDCRATGRSPSSDFRREDAGAEGRRGAVRKLSFTVVENPKVAKVS